MTPAGDRAGLSFEDQVLMRPVNVVLTVRQWTNVMAVIEALERMGVIVALDPVRCEELQTALASIRSQIEEDACRR